MKKNCNKVEHTCGDITFATCVSYEGTVNTGSEYNEEDCLSIEQTTQDIYNQLEQLDLSELGEACLDYVLEEGKLIVKHVLKKHEEEICSLKERIEELENRQLCDLPITECLPDLGCLIDACDNSITTLGQWMLAVQTKICEV